MFLVTFVDFDAGNFDIFFSLVSMDSVKVDIEYCEICNSKQQCEDLSKIIQQMCPKVEVVCHTGRRGSFEVQINNELVHSKLASLAFPEYGDVVKNVKLAAEGKPVSKVKEQPITDCVIQ